MKTYYLLVPTLVLVGLISLSRTLLAQEVSPSPVPLQAEAGDARNSLIGRPVAFDATSSVVPAEDETIEYVWDFGDSVRTTGKQVQHAYARLGTYTVKLRISTADAQQEDTTEVHIFDRSLVLVADGSASTEQLELAQTQAAEKGTLLLVIKAKSSGPEALVEEELTQQLVDARADIAASHLLVMRTSGGVGANVLSKFAQHLRAGESDANIDIGLADKGIIILTETPLGVLSRTAQSVFNQLQPAYVLLTRPDALPLLYPARTAEQAHAAILESPIEQSLLGTFSQRAVTQLGPFNFMSVGINYLVNRGVPINNIVLILMLPVIATILAFARQVIGIKAFGLITPAMTTLSFLVMGLPYGLAVFLVVFLSGTGTRLLVRRLRLLYLPRMALVLTNASLAILVLLGIGVAAERTLTLSFSIFPILILTILAEEFIAVQFKAGARTALTTTAWTLLLAIACYFVVSWELLRTVLLSYPEIVLLAIPFNILLGRWPGLRLTEYIRFRELLRYGK